MEEISKYASAVGTAIEEQSMTTDSIAGNVANAAAESSKVSASLNEFASDAVGARTSAEIVLTAAQEVESAVEKLEGEVENFLVEVAA